MRNEKPIGICVETLDKGLYNINFVYQDRSQETVYTIQNPFVCQTLMKEFVTELAKRKGIREITYHTNYSEVKE